MVSSLAQDQLPSISSLGLIGSLIVVLIELHALIILPYCCCWCCCCCLLLLLLPYCSLHLPLLLTHAVGWVKIDGIYEILMWDMISSDSGLSCGGGVVDESYTFYIYKKLAIRNPDLRWQKN